MLLTGRPSLTGYIVERLGIAARFGLALGKWPPPERSGAAMYIASPVRPLAPLNQETIMRLPRFSIASILVLVLFVAIGFAALREATDAWDSGMLAATLLALLVAVLLAVHRRDERRAFWMGFALSGWLYLVVSLVPSIESRLPTTRGLVYLGSRVQSPQANVAVGSAWSRPRMVRAIGFAPDGTMLAPGGPGSVRIWNTTGASETFVRIGHSLVALLLAFAGGHLSHGIAKHEAERLPEVRVKP
jgi:hypothetical protein